MKHHNILMHAMVINNGACGKGRQHSVHSMPAASERIGGVACKTRSATLDLESDKSRCFNPRDELDSSAAQLPNFRSVWSGN